jgi:putative hemolysin
MFTFVLLRLIGVVLLVAANAFFVAAEYAIVSVRDTRLEQMIEARKTGARTVRKLQNKLDEVLNGIQLGVTMASLALGWVGEVSMARVLEVPLGRLPHGVVYAHAVSVTLAFTLITYFHVILGEVVPKTVSLRQAERVAVAVATPLDIFVTVFSPFTKFMARSSRFVLRIFGSMPLREGGVHSPEELKLIATASRRFGVIPALQEEMIHRALDLETVTVREVMVPRPDIFSLPGDMKLEEAMRRVVEEQHSRVPVYDPARGPEAIIGVLYAKDLMRWMQYGSPKGRMMDSSAKQPELMVRHVMREVLVVPETKPLPDLLVDFKQRKKHLAVVVDEFGSTAGVVSVEDVLEQLVGEIEDEYDVAPQTLIAAGSMTLDGATNVRDLETQFHVELPRDAGYETLAGFVMTRLQKIPRLGDSFEFEGRRYTVKKMDGRRIDTVKIDSLATEATRKAAEENR